MDSHGGEILNFYGLTEEEKMEAIMVALEWEDLLRFQLEHRHWAIDMWDQVKSLLRLQFRS